MTDNPPHYYLTSSHLIFVALLNEMFVALRLRDLGAFCDVGGVPSDSIFLLPSSSCMSVSLRSPGSYGILGLFLEVNKIEE